MNTAVQSVAALAAQATSHPRRPSGLIPFLKRAPNSLRWKLILASQVMERECRGMVHRLQAKRIAHFLHIGKTGGTAMMCALESHLNSGDFEIKLYGHEFKLKGVPRGEKIFFFVRDPVSRFVSGFYSRKRQGQPRHYVPWSPGERAAFGRFSTPNELALALSSNDGERQATAVDAMKSIIHVQSPHWTWFEDETYFLSRESDILFIGSQESLNDDFSLLKRILRLPEDVQLPNDEVSSHRSPTDLDKRLDADAIRNLKEWYQRDYRFLDLCREVAAKARSQWLSELANAEATS